MKADILRYFCPTCGVPIVSIAPRYGPVSILKLGIYPKLPEPEWESFCEKKQKWEKPYEGTIQYKVASKGEKMPGSI